MNALKTLKIPEKELRDLNEVKKVLFCVQILSYIARIYCLFPYYDSSDITHHVVCYIAVCDCEKSGKFQRSKCMINKMTAFQNK